MNENVGQGESGRVEVLQDDADERCVVDVDVEVEVEVDVDVDVEVEVEVEVDVGGSRSHSL